ncbi:hypothetical protein [Serratia rubidaea]|uniref:hypothetical protein n=1 Tax=Serratia rubidaea TaxID=61652 RepID=UPI00092E4F94|nr:hypothetical protein [Serratia rubidaea]MCR0998029.1 nitrogen fixation protein NifS [Serratia rubidaea]
MGGRKLSIGKIYLISKPSQILGRSPFHGMGGGLFGFYKEETYVSCLQKELKIKNIDWSVDIDNTESNIEKLINQGADILVCTPGLRFQFYTNGFNKEDIIYLSMMEYITNNVNPVIKKIKEFCNEKRT